MRRCQGPEKRRLASVLKFLKWLLVLAVTGFAALAATGMYMARKEQAAMEASALIQSLNKFESDKMDQKILTVLVNDINEVSREDAKLVVKWLKPRLGNGNGPYFYLVSLYIGKEALHTKRRHVAERAMEYFTAGQLVYRADAARCNDPTSIQAVMILESNLMGPMKKALEDNPAFRAEALPWALEMEERLKDRKLSTWICAHGIKRFAGGTEPLSTEQWRVERAKARADYSEYMSRKHNARNGG